MSSSLPGRAHPGARRHRLFPPGPVGRRARVEPAWRLVALAALTLTTLLSAVAAPALADTPDAGSIELAPSASCRYGDVDITYAANGATRRRVTFTAADGTVLSEAEGASLGPDFSGTEHVLADATTDQPAGSLLAVHVTVGTTPPTTESTAEFFVLYRCTPASNTRGGANTVVQECHGPFGTCPTTAAGAVADPAPSTTAPSTTAPGGATGSADVPGAGTGSGPGGSDPTEVGSVPPGSTPTGTTTDGRTSGSAPGTGTTTPSGGVTTESSGSSSAAPLVIGAAVVVVLALAGAALLRRRRR